MEDPLPPTDAAPATSGEDLERSAADLTREAHEMLAATRVMEALARLGEVHLVGSVVSELMTHREIDIAVNAGPDFGPSDAFALCAALSDELSITNVEIVDGRNDLSVPERDRRLHLTLQALHGDQLWVLDLSLFTHDAHKNVADWHDRLRATLTREQRRSILRIKHELQGAHSYPGGLAIYTAVLEYQVADTAEFLRVHASDAYREIAY